MKRWKLWVGGVGCAAVGLAAVVLTGQLPASTAGQDRPAMRTDSSVAVSPIADASVDSTPPAFTVLMSALSTGKWTEGVSWQTSDGTDADASGVAYVTARLKSTCGQHTSGWVYPVKWAQLRADGSLSLKYKKGCSYQIEGRAVDNAGNVSAWKGLGGGSR